MNLADPNPILVDPNPNLGRSQHNLGGLPPPYVADLNLIWPIKGQLRSALFHIWPYIPTQFKSIAKRLWSTQTRLWTIPTQGWPSPSTVEASNKAVDLATRRILPAVLPDELSAPRAQVAAQRSSTAGRRSSVGRPSSFVVRRRPPHRVTVRPTDRTTRSTAPPDRPPDDAAARPPVHPSAHPPGRPRLAARGYPPPDCPTARPRGRPARPLPARVAAQRSPSSSKVAPTKILASCTARAVAHKSRLNGESLGGAPSK